MKLLATAPRGYTLVLPPGWTKVPLRAGTEETIAQIVERGFAGFSQDLVDERYALRALLTDLTSKAASNSGLDLYLPTERMHGFTVAASFVVAEFSFGSVESPDPSQILARLLARGVDSKPVSLAGTTAARGETVAPPDPARDVPFASRRVDYVLPVPNDADRWLVVTFSTIGQGDPQDDFATLLVELFDAIMTTFRWTT